MVEMGSRPIVVRFDSREHGKNRGINHGCGWLGGWWVFIACPVYFAIQSGDARAGNNHRVALHSFRSAGCGGVCGEDHGIHTLSGSMPEKQEITISPDPLNRARYISLYAMIF